jgi:hypothetical protein
MVMMIIGGRIYRLHNKFAEKIYLGSKFLWCDLSIILLLVISIPCKRDKYAKYDSGGFAFISSMPCRIRCGRHESKAPQDESVSDCCRLIREWPC